ncbi:MAG: hypothetical protein ABI980_14540, partial [Nitrospirota bacterium]
MTLFEYALFSFGSLFIIIDPIAAVPAFLAMTATDIRPEQDKQAFLQTEHSLTPTPDYVNRGVWNHQKKDGSIIQVEINAHQIVFENRVAKLILANDV